MSETPNRAAVTAWLKALLDGKVPVGQVCGLGKPQAPAGQPLQFPYRVLYSIPGGSVSGPALGQSSGDATYSYQVDSVARDYAIAEAAGAEVLEWIVGRTADGVFVVQAPDPDELRISDRIVDGTPGAPLQEGQPPNQVFTVSHTFAVYVTVE